MIKAGILGHYAFGHNTSNGQTIKTRIFTEALESCLGADDVKTFDTSGGIKSLIRSPFQSLSVLKRCENVIMLPAHNGVRLFGILLPLFKGLFKGRKIHYVVIGGWLPELVKRERGLARSLKKFDGIFVETNTMKLALEEQGFSNVLVMHNFKDFPRLSEEDLMYGNGEPLKLCTFSRINEKKGIGDAVRAVNAINEKLGRTVFTLDIYGSVDAGQDQWFEELRGEFTPNITFGGLVAFDKSVEVIKNYFALLFPTRYYTEGVPGTLIDAYASGVPVISSKWESFSDIVAEGETGLGFEFCNVADLESVLTRVAHDPEILSSMKVNCLTRSDDFAPNTAIQPLLSNL